MYKLLLFTAKTYPRFVTTEKFLRDFNPNKHFRFCFVSVNNLEWFFWKNCFKVFCKSLFSISILNYGAVDLEYQAKMWRIGIEKNGLYLNQRKYFKNPLKNVDRFLKKSPQGHSFQYLCSKFCSCRPLCLGVNVYTGWFTDGNTKFCLRFIVYGHMKKSCQNLR